MKQCVKLAKRTNEWNAIYPFLEWLSQEKDIHLCRPGPKESWLRDHFQPIGESWENLLYEYFEVNPTKLEEERRAILAELANPYLNEISQPISLKSPKAKEDR